MQLTWSNASVFQFLYGTIISKPNERDTIAFLSFQFLYGTIISRWIKRNSCSSDISIPLWYDYKRLYACTWSRLKWISIPLWYDYKHYFFVPNRILWEFQFLYGTIIRRLDKFFKGFVNGFQFLYGTIISQQIAGCFG